MCISEKSDSAEIYGKSMSMKDLHNIESYVNY